MIIFVLAIVIPSDIQRIIFIWIDDDVIANTLQRTIQIFLLLFSWFTNEYEWCKNYGSYIC